LLFAKLIVKFAVQIDMSIFAYAKNHRRLFMPSSPSKLSRRTLFAGAGTAGALAAAVSVMPSVQSLAVSAAPGVIVKPEKGGGYSLSEHVKQYYKTALV
jgi:hypothetical protein